MREPGSTSSLDEAEHSSVLSTPKVGQKKERGDSIAMTAGESPATGPYPT